MSLFFYNRKTGTSDSWKLRRYGEGSWIVQLRSGEKVGTISKHWDGWTVVPFVDSIRSNPDGMRMILEGFRTRRAAIFALLKLCDLSCPGWETDRFLSPVHAASALNRIEGSLEYLKAEAEKLRPLANEFYEHLESRKREKESRSGEEDNLRDDREQ